MPPSITPDFELIGIARRYLGLVRDAFDMEAAWLSERSGGQQVVHVVEGDGEMFGITDGMELPWEGSWCSEMLHGRIPRFVADVAGNARAAELPMTKAHGIGALATTAINLHDGRLFGALTCASRKARPGFGASDERLLQALASALGDELAVLGARSASRQARREQILRVIGGDGLSIVAQPIVRMGDLVPVGVETLSRFDRPPNRPDRWFADAASVGLGRELELTAIALALQLLPDLPGHLYISVNASPGLVLDDALSKLLLSVDPQRVVLEITEHALVASYDQLLARLGALRKSGIRLAVDDAGSGYASFRHILNLGPDIIKLDRDMISGVADDPARQALVRALVDFAERLGATVVAEGIESAEELASLAGLGVALGQGYFIARPAPLKQLALWPARQNM